MSPIETHGVWQRLIEELALYSALPDMRAKGITLRMFNTRVTNMKHTLEAEAKAEMRDRAVAPQVEVPL
jgi:hypothetical protein